MEQASQLAQVYQSQPRFMRSASTWLPDERKTDEPNQRIRCEESAVLKGLCVQSEWL